MEKLIQKLQQIKPKTVNKDGYTGGYADAIDYSIKKLTAYEDENKALRGALEKINRIAYYNNTEISADIFKVLENLAKEKGKAVG